MSANTWTHTLCIACWNARYPEMAQEPLPGEGPEETCCACGRATRDVLPIRAAPETVHPQPASEGAAQATIAWQAVESSNVEAVAYQPGVGGGLLVRFKSGGTYLYAGVPEDEYRALLAAASVGRFVHRHIKPHHACTKLAAPAPEPAAP